MAPDTPTPDRPIPNSYWLPGEKILAGHYPGSFDPEHATRKISSLLDAGVRTFIDLTEAHELDHYDDVLSEEATRRNIDVSHVRISIRDTRAPTIDVMRKILATIEKSLADGRTPYVHCWGGIGRTGTVVGCHLIEQGHSPDVALEIVQSLYEQYEHRDPSYPRSPETDAQHDFVRSWRARDRHPSP